MSSKINRLIYFGYYILTLDTGKLNKYLIYASEIVQKSRFYILADAIKAVFEFNISILDYFQFRLFEKVKSERLKWAGTGFMFEYQRIMNPPFARERLENKVQFNCYFRSFIKREFATYQSIKSDNEITERLLKNTSHIIVLKKSLGQAGKDICFLKTKNLDSHKLLSIMKKCRYDLAEEYVIQHPEMMLLSDTGLNTVRVITQVFSGRIIILATRLRISINSEVDNMAAGNAAAPLDLETGIVSGPAVFSDITKPDLLCHPITGVQIIGFQVPFWRQVIRMVTKAAMMIPENRSVGWDVAITSQGPLLIEGNHNWCKLLWQLPVKKGLKEELEVYL